jgi:hypothetical protein
MQEIQAAVEEKIAQHGGLRAAARVLKMTPAYLCRLRYGIKNNPGDKILRKLGLERTVTFKAKP